VPQFIAAGREDLDVRMLGGGRPFVLEVANARAAAPDAAALAAAAVALAAGGRVAVRQLALLSRAQRDSLHEGAEEKSKTYRAVVSLSRAFTPADADALAVAVASAGPDGLMLHQQTPVRVLHRRAALTRPRPVFSLAARPLPGHGRAFILDLRCGAGAYVKEFIHGDFGRTQPCLADLLPRAPPGEAQPRTDCLQLDVVAVDMEWL
jgi:tRNA pseudouridine synthase 10